MSLPTISSTQDAGKFCTLTTLSRQGCQHFCLPLSAPKVSAQDSAFYIFLPLSTCRQDAILLQVVTCPLQAHAFSLSNWTGFVQVCHFVWTQQLKQIKRTSAFSPFPSVDSRPSPCGDPDWHVSRCFTASALQPSECLFPPPPATRSGDRTKRNSHIKPQLLTANIKYNS